MQYAAVWVGIDGDSCPSAILQVGVDLGVLDNGEVDYEREENTYALTSHRTHCYTLTQLGTSGGPPTPPFSLASPFRRVTLSL